MRKKLFTLFFALVASVGTIFAVSGKCGDNLTWDLTDGVLTISGTGDMTNWSWYSDVPWYPYRENITSVIIGNSVTSIGNYAFDDCTGLTSVTIPNSVTSIGRSAFYKCSGLTSIEIPNSVTSIGGAAFYYCTGLTSVTIPNSVTSIADYTFEGCTGLTSVTIPNSVTSIGGSAFYYCTGLTSVTIPNSVTSIGSSAFYYCTGLTSVTIPGSVTSIADYTFEGCTGLTSVTIPNSVTSIGRYAFYGCTGLTSVTIGNSVTIIGGSAFNACSGLTSITCEATTPPSCKGDAFNGVDKSIPLYVLAKSVDLYKAADVWKDFANILPISAEKTDTDSTVVDPGEHTIDISWPAVDGTYTYEIVIKDKDGNIVCTLIFNSNGQLTSIAFNAPARDDAPQKAQTAGFSFTVTGLEAGTEYNLIITAKDENGQEIDKKNVSFHTEGTQGIDDIHVDSSKTVKVLHDGQIYILRGDKTYTLTGQELK